MKCIFVNQRWLGGLLTNMETVQKSIQRLKELEAMATEDAYAGRPKKEIIRLERERKALDLNLAGIKDMPGLPDLVFVVDSNKEAIAVREARKLRIPVVAVVDTNCDPDMVDYVIPGNDDALRAIRLFTAKIADAVIEGRSMATEQDFTQEAAVETDDTAIEDDEEEYSKYLDPQYSEQLMSESLSQDTIPPLSPPTTPPTVESGEQTKQDGAPDS